MSYETTWFLAFLMTQGIEVPLYMRFGGLSFLRALVPSAITHPIVWFVFFHPAVPLSWPEKFILAEVFAWLAEAAYLRWSRPAIPRMTLRRAVLLSLAVNGASLTAGLLSSRWFGFP